MALTLLTTVWTPHEDVGLRASGVDTLKKSLAVAKTLEVVFLKYDG